METFATYMMGKRSREIQVDSAQSQDPLSDREVVRQVLDGSKESYGILIERYQNLAYRLALRMLGDLDMSQDAVQEAFIIGYQNLERLENPGAFSSWIAGITKNTCRSILRDWKKHPVSLEYLAEIGIEPGDSGNPSSYDKELIEAVRRLLPTLPEKYREVVELRYTEGHSCQKIADFLSLSKSAVVSRLYYARKRLLKMLRKEGWE